MACSYEGIWKVICGVKNEEMFATLLPGFEHDHNRISKLRKNYPNGSEQFAKEIARMWLEKHPEKATWINLIETLRSECIEENTLAQDLEEKYIRQRGSISSTGSSFTSSIDSSWTESATFGDTIYSQNSMDVTPTLETADSMDETSGVTRSDSLATTSDCSSPPTSPMSLSSASSPSSSLAGFPKARRDERVNYIYRISLMKVKRYFSEFVDEVKQGFACITLNIEAVKNQLRDYCPVISDLNDMDSIITWFINKSYWDHWNSDDLCLIVNDFGDERLKKAEKEYRVRRGQFLAATKLKDYLSANNDALSRKTGERPSNKHVRSSRKYRCKLSAKLEVEVSKQTLDYIEKLWDRAKVSQLLPPIGVVLDNICTGCVEVVWIILNSKIIPGLREKAQLPEAVEFYKENRIIRVMLNDDECLYSTKDDTASISSDILKLSISDSMEEEPEESTLDKETVEPLKTASPITDKGDEIENKKESDKEAVGEEPVELKSVAKEERISVSEMLLAECSKKEADIEVVRGYLEHPDCDVRIREDDEFKWTPLMWACENKHFKIGRLLLKCQPPPQVDIQDKKEWSPLILASRAGDLEIVKGIVELGADIDKPTNKKWTPLMWAAHKGHVEVARFLLEKGAAVDDDDENGWTPLVQASQEGHVNIVNLLLEYNADVNCKTKTSWCALMAAVKNKNSEVVEALLKKGAQVDIKRKGGTTALQVASFFEENSDIMKILIKHKANVDHLSEDGMSALLYAINKGHLELVKALLDGGSNVELKHPETGWTPVLFAAKCGNMDIVKELLHRGAKPEVEGRNVIDVAALFEHKEMVSELKTILPEIETQEDHQEQPTGLLETPLTTTKTEVEEKEAVSTDPLPAVEASVTTPAAQDSPKMTLEINIKNTKKSEEKPIARKSIANLKQEAMILDQLLKDNIVLQYIRSN